MSDERKVIGYLGVDAGLMYLGDPGYLIGPGKVGAMAWADFLKTYVGGDQAQHWRVDNIGIVVSTGWGDGIYPVTAKIRDGRLMSVTINFDLPEEEP